MATLSIVPGLAEDTIYLVVNDFGRHGRAFVETDVAQTDLETVLKDIASGAYSEPIKICAFNTSEGWSREVTQEIGAELLARAQRGDVRLCEAAQYFVEFQTGKSVPIPTD